MAELPQQGEHKPHMVGMSRRNFLKLFGIGGASLALWKLYPLLAESVSSDPRPEPDKQLSDVFTAYESYRAENPDLHLGQLHYTRPVNYLNLGDLIGKSPNAKDMEKNDKPGSSFVQFSLDDIHGPKDLLQFDPGSGILAGIRSGITTTYGADPLTNLALLDNPDVLTYTEQHFRKWFMDAQDYVIGATKDKKISTSALKLYFLTQNNGDIMKSLWDTVLWLKVAARNNPDDLTFSPQLSEVKFLAKHIDDTFAKEPLSDVLKKHIDPYAPDGIIPRAGILYHGENLETLAGCMEPILVQAFLEAYYLVKTTPSGDGHSTSGQDAKKESDQRIVGYVQRLKDVLERYAV